MKNKIENTGAVHYVLGLCFSETGNQMATILKDRPAFQAGKWNGTGGKIEAKDGLYSNFKPAAKNAMVREFKEETGKDTNIDSWQRFATITILNDPLGGVAVIHCLRRFNNDVFECQTQETEKIEVHTVADLCSKLPVAPNLPMLISVALNKNVNFVEITLEK